MKHFIFLAILFISNLGFAQPEPPSINPVHAAGNGLGPAVKLSFGTGAKTVTVGTCSSHINVRTLNSSNQIVTVTQPTTVSIQGAPATFYSDAACTQEITAMVIPTGGYRVIFYLSSLDVGKVTITASSPGLTMAAQKETITATQVHSVSLSWNASTSQNIASYNVYRGTQNGGPYTKIGSTLSTVLDYDDTQVVAGATYYYVVTAVDTSNEESGYSNQATAVIP